MQEEASQEVEDFATEDRDLFIAYHWDTIQKIGRKKGWGLGFTESEDVSQAIVEHVLQKWNLYSGRPASRVRAFFEKAANQYIRQESDDYMYFTASYLYTPAEVRFHLRESTWVESEQCPDVNARVDLQAAFKTLTKTRQRAVYKYYALGVPLEEMTDADRRSVFRGVDAITNWLNRKESPRAYSLDEIRAKAFARA